MASEQNTEYLSINVAEAGTLPSLITERQKQEVTHLTVTGELNGSDILVIREMSGIDNYGWEVDDTNLTSLDMSGARIVSGGTPYYFSNTTEDDIIGESMFAECSRLTSISIPESTKSIEWEAFSGCTGLTFFKIPDTTTYLGDDVFSGCSNITEIKVGQSVTKIDGYAFQNCSSLQTINLPEGLTEISEFMFSECISLPEITLPSTCTRICTEAFNGCTALKTIVIPEGLAYIGDSAFYRCSSLEEISLPSTALQLGESLFYGCSSLAHAYLPEGLTTITESMFSNCGALLNITIPKNVEEIGRMAFCDAKSLESIVIPDNVTTIGKSAFFNCLLLSTVELGAGLENLGEDVFKFCENLRSINVSEYNQYYASLYGVLTNKDESELLFVPCAYATTYSIPESVTIIGKGAFKTNMTLTDVITHDNVTAIGDMAFESCQALENITIGQRVSEIGEDAFFSVKTLSNIYCRVETPIEIDSYVFWGVDKDSCKLYVPKGCAPSYREAKVWNEFVNIIDDIEISSESECKIATNVCINGRTLTISPYTNYSVYTPSGNLLYHGNDTQISLDYHGICIVRTGTQTHKTII